MNENLFLLYNHYGIKETFTDSQIIFHAVNRSYRDFWRQIHFHGKNVFNQDTKNEYKSESFLKICHVCLNQKPNRILIKHIMLYVIHSFICTLEYANGHMVLLKD